MPAIEAFKGKNRTDALLSGSHHRLSRTLLEDVPSCPTVGSAFSKSALLDSFSNRGTHVAISWRIKDGRLAFVHFLRLSSSSC